MLSKFNRSICSWNVIDDGFSYSEALDAHVTELLRKDIFVDRLTNIYCFCKTKLTVYPKFLCCLRCKIKTKKLPDYQQYPCTYSVPCEICNFRKVTCREVSTEKWMSFCPIQDCPNYMPDGLSIIMEDMAEYMRVAEYFANEIIVVKSDAESCSTSFNPLKEENTHMAVYVLAKKRCLVCDADSIPLRIWSANPSPLALRNFEFSVNPLTEGTIRITSTKKCDINIRSFCCESGCTISQSSMKPPVCKKCGQVANLSYAHPKETGISAYSLIIENRKMYYIYNPILTKVLEYRRFLQRFQACNPYASLSISNTSIRDSRSDIKYYRKSYLKSFTYLSSDATKNTSIRDTERNTKNTSDTSVMLLQRSNGEQKEKVLVSINVPFSTSTTNIISGSDIERGIRYKPKKIGKIVKKLRNKPEAYHLKCGSGLIFLDPKGILKCKNCGDLCKQFKCENCMSCMSAFDGRNLICTYCCHIHEIFSKEQHCASCHKKLEYNEEGNSWFCSECKFNCITCGKILESSTEHNGRLRCLGCIFKDPCFSCNRSIEQTCDCTNCRYCGVLLKKGRCPACSQKAKCGRCHEPIDDNHKDCFKKCSNPEHRRISLYKTKCSHTFQKTIPEGQKHVSDIQKHKEKKCKARDYGYNCKLCVRYDKAGAPEYYCDILKVWYLKNCSCCPKRNKSQRVGYYWCLDCPCFCGYPMNPIPNSKGFYFCSSSESRFGSKSHSNQGCFEHRDTSVSNTNGVCRICDPKYRCECGNMKIYTSVGLACIRNCGLTRCHMHDLPLTDNRCPVCDSTCGQCFTPKVKLKTVWDCPYCSSWCRKHKRWVSPEYPCACDTSRPCLIKNEQYIL